MPREELRPGRPSAWATVAVLTVVAMAGCSTGGQGVSGSAPSAPYASALPTTPGQTVFSAGVHTAASNQDGWALGIKVLKELGVSTTRTQVTTIGQPDQPMSAEYQAFRAAGIRVLLNIYNKDRNGPAVTNKAGKNKPVSGPPTDLGTYQAQVAKLLDTYQPALVSVENEENGRYYNGTPAQYSAELKAATDVAHQKGYKVSDGGLTGVPLSLVVWKDYWDRG